MGYRSDVTLAFYTCNREELPFSSLKFWFDENYPRKVAVEEWGAEIDCGTDFVLVTYQHAKWYDDYGHVKAVERAIEAFTEAFDCDNGHEPAIAAWEMVDIGEEVDDIKRKHSAWCEWRLDVRREAVFC